MKRVSQSQSQRPENRTFSSTVSRPVEVKHGVCVCVYACMGASDNTASAWGGGVALVPALVLAELTGVESAGTLWHSLLFAFPSKQILLD